MRPSGTVSVVGGIMNVPQITQAQVDAVVSLCNPDGNNAFTLVLPEKSKDADNVYKARMAELLDINQLVILGLLKDITDECTQKVAEFFTITQRALRIYQITDVGKAMFANHNTRVLQ